MEIRVPIGKAYLPFQQAGIEFLLSRRGALLADEMGLGKTIQAIGFLNNYSAWQRALIIPPAHLRLVWLDELRQWLIDPAEIAIATAASLPMHYHRGLGDGERRLLIAHYEAVTRHAVALRSIDWDVIIVDEAHYCKNPQAARTRAVFGVYERDRVVMPPIRAKRVILLTGTPIFARPLELWPLVRRIDPEGLGKRFFPFALRYCNAHQEYIGGRTRWVFDGASNLEELRVRLSTLMLRRTKNDVLSDLPAKIRQVITIPGTAELRRLVDKERALLNVDASEGNVDLADFELVTDRLRSVAVAGDLMRIRHLMGLAKVPIVVEHLEDLLSEVEKIVVFTHHIDVAQEIARALASYNPVIATGEETMQERHDSVTAFQSDSSTRLFIGTMGAAGTGVTLTAASTVVFAEMDWTPAVLEQAEDRCHRIGQSDCVRVHYIVADRSVDAIVARVVARKAVILQRFFATGGSPASPTLDAQSLVS